jgi:pimeloyl-ACP methyl ester carboxylesterase
VAAGTIRGLKVFAKGALPMKLDDAGFLDIAGARLEYRFIGPRADQAPTLVLLHEGLGCIEMWGDFPARLAEGTGAGVFVYSRAGYGHSSPAKLPRPVSYMHDEARETLPRILDAIGFRRGLFVGHSDGASIAAIYAGSSPDHRVRGLVLIAPHFVVEDVSIAAIAAARTSYEQGDLRGKLARYHSDVDNAFRGWNDVWLDPAFRNWDISEELAYIRVPILIVQGADDQYGTPRQIEIAREECYCPVDAVLLPGVRHAPHREASDVTLDHVRGFARRILYDHAESAVRAA